MKKSAPKDVVGVGVGFDYGASATVGTTAAASEQQQSIARLLARDAVAEAQNRPGLLSALQGFKDHAVTESLTRFWVDVLLTCIAKRGWQIYKVAPVCVECRDAINARQQGEETAREARDAEMSATAQRLWNEAQALKAENEAKKKAAESHDALAKAVSDAPVVAPAPSVNVPVPGDGIYTDGGVIQKNPSTIGGTWAWCRVENGEQVESQSGLLLPSTMGGNPVTNNNTELLAILHAVRLLPAGWEGTLYSDSKIALGWVFHGFKTDNVPASLLTELKMQRARLNTKELCITPVLLAGHPKQEHLEQGWRIRDGSTNPLPVSKWNVWCDSECTKQAKKKVAETVDFGQQEGVGK